MSNMIIAIGLLLLSSGEPVAGQGFPGVLSDQARLSVLTVGPADPIYTLFGHTAIRLQDPRHNIDRVYNYGTFDFNTSGFYMKFLYGDLHYFLSTGSFEAFRKDNEQLGRSIVSQTLNLSRVELISIVQTLEQHMNPPNRYYSYEFFANNCVTKVRDLLTEQNLLSASPYQPAGTIGRNPTYRQLVSSYLEGRPWVKLGINLLLGSPADHSVSSGHLNFLPDPLFRTLETSRLDNGKPLIESTQLILPAQPTDSRHQIVTPTHIFWLLFLVMGFITLGSAIREWNDLWIDRLLFGLVGLAGVVITFTTLFSHHEPLQYNWNLLWALPTHLLIAVGTGSYIRHTWFKYYLRGTSVLCLLLFAGLPFIPQQLPAFVIPVIGMLAIRLLLLLNKGTTLSWNKTH